MRDLSTHNAANVAGPVTRPLWLVYLGFGTPLRLSSREEITIGSDTYSGANIRVDLKGFRLAIFNENLQWSSLFLSGVSGTAVKIWAVWGEGPFDSADLDLWFDGELGQGTVGTTIKFNLRPSAPKQTPRLSVTPPTFNHLPPAGAEIITPLGIYVLQGSE